MPDGTVCFSMLGWRRIRRHEQRGWQPTGTGTAAARVAATARTATASAASAGASASAASAADRHANVDSGYSVRL